MGWELKGTPEPVQKTAEVRADLPVAPEPIPGVAVEVKPEEKKEEDAKAQ